MMTDEHDEPSFDMEAVYDAEIAPLMAQIIEICKREGMPFLASFMYANNIEEDGVTSYCTSYAPHGSGWVPDKLNTAKNFIRTPPRTIALAITTTK